MRVGIFTSRSLNPLHPRLEALTVYLKSRNIDFEIIEAKTHVIGSRINWLFLFFFDVYSAYSNRKRINDFDTVIIQDLKNLPLARYSKKKGKRVIYETLDNNVHLRTYLLVRRFRVFRLFEKRIIKTFERKEKNTVFRYCDEIIVNSKALKSYFNDKATLIYYSSSFERIKSVNDKKNLPALLYLGDFSSEKGADEILELQRKYSVPMFIFGTVNNPGHLAEITGNSLIKYNNRLSHKDLLPVIENLMAGYFLIGTSLIRPVNFSYASQEANKDIDYLALGIPIIGNHRFPTEEKIYAGCGVFAENEADIKNLISSESMREEIAGICRNYYVMHYSFERFTNGLDNIFGK